MPERVLSIFHLFHLAVLPVCYLALAALLCVSALAQEKPDAPKPKHDRKEFIVGTALLAASKRADAITTRQLLDRGGWENNPVFGRHPSPAKQSLINLGFFVAQPGVFYLTERNRHSWVRWAGRAFIGHAIFEHSLMAACNSGLNPQGTQIQKCLPLVPYL